jgi:RNA polymerase sigma-70 factor (ECF subfamily)
MIQPNSDLLASAADSDRTELIDLVRRVQSGEAGAQRELLQRYSRRMTGFVRSIIRQPDAVEDVTQTVFIKLFQRIGRLREPAQFQSWLFTLARNTALDFIRRRGRRPQAVAGEEELNALPDERDDAATAEILEALDGALQHLGPIDRNVVTQFVAGESYLRIAASSGLTLGAVKVRLHRVRPFLRQWVGARTESRTPGAKGWCSPARRHAA